MNKRTEMFQQSYANLTDVINTLEREQLMPKSYKGMLNGLLSILSKAMADSMLKQDSTTETSNV